MLNMLKVYNFNFSSKKYIHISILNNSKIKNDLTTSKKESFNLDTNKIENIVGNNNVLNDKKINLNSSINKDIEKNNCLSKLEIDSNSKINKIEFIENKKGFSSFIGGIFKNLWLKLKYWWGADVPFMTIFEWYEQDRKNSKDPTKLDKFLNVVVLVGGAILLIFVMGYNLSQVDWAELIREIFGGK